MLFIYEKQFYVGWRAKEYKSYGVQSTKRIEL